MNGHAIEAVRFRLADGIEEAEFLRRVRPVDDWLQAQPGFLRRRLSCGPDGVWLDHLEWESLAEAEAASAKLMTEPALAPFGAAIREEGLEMRHEVLRGGVG